MKKATIKEIHKFLKTLEENRYRKLVKSECRRIAWFVNNDLSEDYDAMPDSLRKKWVKAEYKKEKYLAKKFLEYLELKQEQKLRESIRNIIKRLIWEERKTLGRKDLKTMQ
mgnify:FL=1